eukprot:1194575-Prorocentrum_minimum.AAC.5
MLASVGAMPGSTWSFPSRRIVDLSPDPRALVATSDFHLGSRARCARARLSRGRARRLGSVSPRRRSASSPACARPAHVGRRGATTEGTTIDGVSPLRRG